MAGLAGQQHFAEVAGVARAAARRPPGLWLLPTGGLLLSGSGRSCGSCTARSRRRSLARRARARLRCRTRVCRLRRGPRRRRPLRLFGFGEWSVRCAVRPSALVAVVSRCSPWMSRRCCRRAAAVETRITTDDHGGGDRREHSAPPTPRARARVHRAVGGARRRGVRRRGGRGLSAGLRASAARWRRARRAGSPAAGPASAASSAAIVCAHARPASEPRRKVRVFRRSATPGCWPSR